MIGGVDIGGTKIAVGVVDPQGRILAKNECPTDAPRGFDHAMRQVTALLSQCAEQAGTKLHGIGIGCAGPVDAVTGALGNVNNLPGWKGNPVEVLAQEFGVPTALENDADAAALGELYWGAGGKKVRFLYVTVGTGIGVSVILDGKVYRGVNGCHPEIGHHIIDASGGPPCSCGVRGCWESLAAGPAMTAWLNQNAPASYGNRTLSAREICSRAQDSDRWAQRAVEREAYFLGLGLANLITLFAPEAIVLGGSVMKSAQLFLDRMREVIAQNCRLVPTSQVEITLASLGADAGLIGAAQVWHHRLERCGGKVGY